MSQGVAAHPLPPGSPSYHRPYTSQTGVKVGYEEDWTKQHFLECDGLSLPFYQMLYRKEVGREDTVFPVRIPETVVFEHNFPQAWFCFDDENKELIKRPGRMLDAATMYEFFSVPTSNTACTTVAQFYHVSVSVDEEWRGVMSKRESKEGRYSGQHITYVEFFDAERLHRFLFGQHRKPNGVLQRFVVPKGQGMSRKNSQIQVLWTPSITSAHMRVNRYRIDDVAVSCSDRMATYDGAPHLSQEVIVADETKGVCTSICEGISKHFFCNEKKRVSRLLLYFKMDDTKLWLLWCGGLRVEPDTLNASFLRVPLMLHMRREVKDEDTPSTTIDRTHHNRQRQKRLLALDYELFKITGDTQFAIAVNNTHRRQAKALHMRGLRHPKLRDGDPDPRRNPKHPLHESFIRICEAADAEMSINNLGQQEAGGKHASRPGSTKDNMPLAKGATLMGKPESAEEQMLRLQRELEALAMDVWYELYSSTLSTHPQMMSTSHMALSGPLAPKGVLTGEEHKELCQLLRISPQAIAGGDSDNQAAVYHVDGGVLGKARRLDKPSSQVQREVHQFFQALFELRGDEVVDKCLSDDFKSYFED